jgi:hypothetical protein
MTQHDPSGATIPFDRDRTFFEYLGLADVERVHSQVLAWILSADCRAYSEPSRCSLFHELFGFEPEGTVTVHTEFEHVDLVVETADRVVMVENKLKTSQHSDQLNRYRAIGETKFRGKHVDHYFLTLVAERAEAPWKILSYDRLHDALMTIPVGPDPHGYIVMDYIRSIGRLTAVVRHFATHHQDYDRVFLDGSTSKAEKRQRDWSDPRMAFVANNQLETILQKYHLKLLADEIKARAYTVGETRGVAFLDIYVQRGLLYAGEKYFTALQFQGGTVKFQFVSTRYARSSKEEVAGIVPYMRALTEGSERYRNLNAGTSKAYLSVSGRLTDGPYWKLDKHKLAALMNNELLVARSFTDQLLREVPGLSVSTVGSVP